MAYLLIVDDDEDFAGAMATVLRSAGHEVAVELDTRAAIPSIKDRRPDLVILDVMFPEGDSAGFDLARDIRRESAKFKDVPVLMLTAVNSSFRMGFGSQNIDAEWMPVSDFLEKPVDFDLLKSKVAGLLSGISAAT